MTFEFEAQPGDLLSFAQMLIATNDAFVEVNSLEPLASLVAWVEEIVPAAPGTGGAGAGAADERALLEGAVETMRGRLEAAAQEHAAQEAARRELVAAISHDLRTPIASASLLLAAMEDGMLDAQTERRYRADLRRELDRTTRLINDLFDYSVIDAGRLQLERTATNPEVLVSESLEAIRPEAGRKAIALETAFEHGLSLLDADPWRLQRALCNLLVNAVRHTPPQGRIVAAARQAEGAVAFTVADSGAGVAAGQAEQIFEPFFRGDRARSSDGSGAGLGLAIARGIAEAHSGSLQLEATSEAGCRFRLLVPIATGG